MSPMFVPEHLITDILTFFPVKSLLRLKCVSISLNNLISDPTFIKLHLQRSLQNRNLLCTYEDRSFVSIPINLYWITKHLSPFPLTKMIAMSLVHAIGLIRFWNPATGTISDKLSSFREKLFPETLGYTFGYDISTDTYKIVAFRLRGMKVFCSTYKVWTEIPNFPAKVVIDKHDDNKGVYLGGTLNWFAFLDELSYNDTWDAPSVVGYLIISLDLATETCRDLLPPPVFDKAYDIIDPRTGVLNDCLCIYYRYLRDNHFVVWQMTQFGVEQSWTQLCKISYENLRLEKKISEYLIYRRLQLYPLYLSKNGVKLILASDIENQAIIYNLRDNRVDRTNNTNQSEWHVSKDYVESLVPTS